jgi:hypothetical protein
MPAAAAAAAAAWTCACAEATAEEVEEDMLPVLPLEEGGPRREPLLGLMATGDGAPEEPVGLAEGWGDMARGWWVRCGA